MILFNLVKLKETSSCSWEDSSDKAPSRNELFVAVGKSLPCLKTDFNVSFGVHVVEVTNAVDRVEGLAVDA